MVTAGWTGGAGGRAVAGWAYVSVGVVGGASTGLWRSTMTSGRGSATRARGCGAMGRLYDLGIGREIDAETSWLFHRKACEGGLRGSCERADALDPR